MPETRRFCSLEEHRLLTPDDLAAILGCTKRAVYNRRHRGDLPPPIKLGALLRWDPQVLADWIESQVEDGRVTP